MDFGTTLKRLRKIYGYTAEDFGTEIGVSRSYLSEIENNKKTPNITFLEKAAKALEIKPSTFLLLAESDDQIKERSLTERLIRTYYIKQIEKYSRKVDDLGENNGD